MKILCWLLGHRMEFAGKSPHELGHVQHYECKRCKHHIRHLHVTKVTGPIRGQHADLIMWDECE